MNKILNHNKNIIQITIRNYAFKSDLKIKWVRPEKIPCYKPEKSGDLSPFPKINKSEYLHEFRKSKELETADENVKRLFTLEFNSRKYSTQFYNKRAMEEVKRHEFDTGSIEIKLARWTGYIRAWQEAMERFPRNKRLKVKLKEVIDMRKKHLRYLRRWDYKKFEWILENLNLIYKPSPTESTWVTRKGSLVKLTDKYCADIKKDKLEKYRYLLEAEQPAFLEEKLRTLQFIRNEQNDCGVEVTVSDDEINKVKQLLEELKLKRTPVEEN
ncbi:28S ribosomal protein S15, mitochondrial [Sitophilus oryzae]|uniref:Small ribosomal subunit protein uS15m n=1 Tax=Sitophilus oryzae TaxID=7048 RepID=A0A6J2X6S6_SITOR|nr:28S ribosomal protein S15, mitochondrial [Sitophilus oryzae]